MVTKELYICSDGIYPQWKKERLDFKIKLPYKSCSLDLIVVDRMLEQTHDLSKAIVEWRRVIKLGGQFIIVFSDVIKAAFLFQRRTISVGDLQEVILNRRSVTSLENIENLLLIKYVDVREEYSHKKILDKKIWETILVAQK